MSDERKRFKVPKPAPMSDLVPASDYVIAQRMAKLQEKWHELSATKDHSHSLAMVEIARQRDAIWAEHDKQVKEYDEWIANGRPILPT